MHRKILVAVLLAALLPAAQAEVQRRTVNDGQLVLEDVLAIPATIVEDLNRYQNVRSASVLDWSADGSSLYVSTRFGEVAQIHRVDMPGGARTQLTFFPEPAGGVSRQPQGTRLLFSMDTGGSDFAQVQPASRCGHDPVAGSAVFGSRRDAGSALCEGEN